MLRQVIASVSAVLVGSISIALMPSMVRAQTYEQCLSDAAQTRRDLINTGTSQTVADQVFNALVIQCNKKFGK